MYGQYAYDVAGHVCTKVATPLPPARSDKGITAITAVVDLTNETERQRKRIAELETQVGNLNNTVDALHDTVTQKATSLAYARGAIESLQRELNAEYKNSFLPITGLYNVGAEYVTMSQYYRYEIRPKREVLCFDHTAMHLWSEQRINAVLADGSKKIADDIMSQLKKAIAYATGREL